MAHYINTEKAINAILGEAPDAHYPEWYAALLMELPDDDVVPVKHGVWIPIRESQMTGWQPELAGRDPVASYVCSSCKQEAIYNCNDEHVLSHYCPNCGAKMDGGDNDAAR